MTPVTRARARGDSEAGMIAAAREVFGRDGYHGASLREVARRARVSEALLYRYFPGRSALFRAAVEEPFDGFVDDFIAEWDRLGSTVGNDEMVALFVRRLHGFAVTHRPLLYAMITAGPEATPVLAEGIRRLARYTAGQAGQRGIASVDLEMAAAHTVGTVLASVLHGTLLYPADVAPERALTELTRYTAAGVQQNPSAPGLNRPGGPAPR